MSFSDTRWQYYSVTRSGPVAGPVGAPKVKDSLKENVAFDFRRKHFAIISMHTGQVLRKIVNATDF